MQRPLGQAMIVIAIIIIISMISTIPWSRRTRPGRRRQAGSRTQPRLDHLRSLAGSHKPDKMGKGLT